MGKCTRMDNRTDSIDKPDLTIAVRLRLLAKLLQGLILQFSCALDHAFDHMPIVRRRRNDESQLARLGAHRRLLVVPLANNYAVCELVHQGLLFHGNASQSSAVLMEAHSALLSHPSMMEVRWDSTLIHGVPMENVASEARLAGLLFSFLVGHGG